MEGNFVYAYYEDHCKWYYAIIKKCFEDI